MNAHRFQRDKSDPSVIVFSEIKRRQLPHFIQCFQKAKNVQPEALISQLCFSTSSTFFGRKATSQIETAKQADKGCKRTSGGKHY
jgi:hypothetical protein